MASDRSHMVVSNAEICWRNHNILVFIFAACLDLQLIDSTRGLYSFNQSIRQQALQGTAFPFSRLIQLCVLLRDTNLKIHPRYASRTDIIDLASSLIDHDRYPVLSFEICNYFMFETDKLLDYCKQAYLKHPTSRRLLAHLGEKGPFLAKAWRYNSNLLQVIDSYHQPQSVFTTIVQMAIGHYGQLVDYAIAIRPHLNPTQTIHVYTCFGGVGNELLSYLKEIGIHLQTHDVLDAIQTQTIQQLSSFYDCNPTFQSVGSTIRKNVESTLSKPGSDRIRRKAVLHLRSNSFKSDGSSQVMAIRSVQQSTYQQLVSDFVSNGWSVTQVTAEDNIAELTDTRLLKVLDSKSATAQWIEFGQSSTIIGTQSGISHLSGLTGFSALLTNHISLPFERLLSNHHLVACKRVVQTKDFGILRPHEILYMIVEPWIMRPSSLSAYTDIIDLSSEELLQAGREFRQIVHNKPWKFTFHSLILEATNSPDAVSLFPNWNLSSFTYYDFKALLKRLSKFALVH